MVLSLSSDTVHLPRRQAVYSGAEAVTMTKACPPLRLVWIEVAALSPQIQWYLPDLHFLTWRPFANSHGCLVPDANSVPPSSQDLVLDIYYQGTKAEIQRCVRPDGLVPLVWFTGLGMRGPGDFGE